MSSTGSTPRSYVGRSSCISGRFWQAGRSRSSIFILPDHRSALVAILTLSLAIHGWRIVRLAKTSAIQLSATQHLLVAGPVLLIALFLIFAYAQVGADAAGFAWCPFKSVFISIGIAEAFAIHVDFAVVSHLRRLPGCHRVGASDV